MKLIKTAVNPLSRGVKFKKFGVIERAGSRPEMPWEKKSQVSGHESRRSVAGEHQPFEGHQPAEGQVGMQSSNSPVALQGPQSLTRLGRFRSRPLGFSDQWIYYGTAVMTLFLALVFSLYSQHHGGSKPRDPATSTGPSSK